MPVLEDTSLETRLASSRGVFERVRSLSGTGEVSAEQLNVIEEVLLRSDVGVVMTQSVLDELRTNGAPAGVAAALRAILLDSFRGDRHAETGADDGRVAVWLFVGVNGVGKTTTIGKLAKRQHDEGRSVLLAAGDTFRAAAADQLEQWAARSGAEIVRATEGADPGSVVHDAIGRAKARGIDLFWPTPPGAARTARTCWMSWRRCDALPIVNRVKSWRLCSCWTRRRVRMRSVRPGILGGGQGHGHRAHQT